MVAYVDASALTKLCREENESRELNRFLGSVPALTSTLLVRVEVLRALRRASEPRETVARAERVLERVNLRHLSDEILTRASRITPDRLRTLDAIHLATALDLSPPPGLFLCYDRRLGEAARMHGLAVVSPGLDEVHEA